MRIRLWATAAPLATLLTLAGCASPTPPAAQPPPSALQPAGSWGSNYVYTLSAVRSCEIGDGITVIENISSQPVRLSDISVHVEGASPHSYVTTYQVLSLKAGSTTGELAPSFSLAALGNGEDISPAIGATLAPVSVSGLWYAIVARLRITAAVPAPWTIEGIGVRYQLAAKSYAASFKQTVNLPATSTCR